MPPTIISKKASNWVDRGEPAYAPITRVLSRFLNENPTGRGDWFRAQAEIISAMVAADATEVHLVGYLRTLLAEREEQEPTYDSYDSASIRVVAIALWHIAKAALVRDFAERVLKGEVPVNEPTPDNLSHWLASRLLSPEELAQFEADRASEDSQD